MPLPTDDVRLFLLNEHDVNGIAGNNAPGLLQNKVEYLVKVQRTADGDGGRRQRFRQFPLLMLGCQQAFSLRLRLHPRGDVGVDGHHPDHLIS